MTQHERVTFTQGREVVEHGIRHLARIRDVLDELREQEHPERVRMLLDAVEIEQRNLLGALERWLEDAPGKALTTYAQYTVELPVRVDAPEAPLSTLSLTQWLARQNTFLLDTFRELADKGDGNDAAELFGGIARQVEAHDRKLSKEYQRLEDL